MRDVVVASRGQTAIRHLAADDADRTLCRRRFVAEALSRDAVALRSTVTDCEACQAREIEVQQVEALKREWIGRGMWTTRDAKTGELKSIYIADMPDSHLLAAIAYCERKGAEFAAKHGISDEPGIVAFTQVRWPALGLLKVEARRRFDEATLAGMQAEWAARVPEPKRDEVRSRAIRLRDEPTLKGGGW